MLRFIFTIFIINCLFTDISFAQSTIVSHEAEYELSLAEPPKTGLGLTAAGGVMKYKTEYTEDCQASKLRFVLYKTSSLDTPDEAVTALLEMATISPSAAVPPKSATVALHPP